MAATATAAGGAAKHDSGVDEDLYSRQLAVFGAETMGKLMQLKVLIIGMRGTGVEIAKNLTLAGPKSVVIHDPTPVTLPDLGNNFYLRESDVGKRRDEATLEQLSDLNKYVKVTVLPSMEGLDFSAFDVVVAADQVQSKSVAWNAAARAAGAAFILADVAGVTARIFTDFGAEHVVLDTNGENPKVAIVNAMVHNDDGSLTVFCDGRTGLVEGNHVNFKEITGATALNDVVAVPVTKLSATGATFTVPASALPADLGEYTGPGGIVTQAKLPVTLAFAPLSERLDQPFPSDKQGGIDIVDYSKMGRAYTLHAAYQGLDAFAAANGGAAPAPHSPEDVAAVLEGAKAFVAGQLAKPEVVEAWTAAAWQPPPEVDEEVVTSTARYAAVQLPGLAAFIGGVAAQEIVKLTGKYTPLRQWLYWDTFEAVPKPEPAADFAGTGDRYHFSNVIFGKTVTDLVRQQRVFLVGAGALGCEYLKSFALAGVGTAGEGKIIVTDMDNIETSNLNRQFLFRTKDVGSAKSVCGAAAAQAMNPDMKGRVEAMEERVGGETEDIFGERFWSGVDIVTNALDNVAARRYMDERCVWFSKPLLESGTLGTMGNTMPIFTRMTKTYNDSQDVEGDSIPMCTLKNFPYQIEHCIEWARDQFEGLFTQSIAEARSFVTDPADWTAEWNAEGAKLGPGVARSKATAVLEVLDLVQGATWEGCVHHARLRFEEVFAARVKQLIHNFPEDKRTANGSLFWSGKRRYPTPAAFDVADPMHCAYVAHGAALFANCFGVAIPADWSVPEALGKVAATAAVPEWAPRAEVIKTEEDGDEVKEGASDDKEAVVALGQRLAKVGGEGAAVLAALADKLTPEEFEKDDDNNHHIDFITAASNLRAGNYRIDALSRHKTKVIAGKITPAIATTTCAVTGLNMIEFYKFVQFNAGVGIEKAVEATRESNMNLAVSHYQLFEAAPTKVAVSREDDTTLTTYRSVPEGFTKWDRIEVPADLPDTTLQGVVDFVVGWAVAKSKEEAAGNADLSEVDAAACTPYLLGDAGLLMYNASEPSTHDTLSKDVFSLYEELITAKGGPKPKPEYIVLHSFSVQIDGDDELELPTVVVNRPPAGPGAAAQ